MTELAPPVLVGNLYLDGPLPDLEGEGRYQGARLLAWLHGRPLGEITLPLGGQPVPAQAACGRGLVGARRPHRQALRR